MLRIKIKEPKGRMLEVWKEGPGKEVPIREVTLKTNDNCLCSLIEIKRYLEIKTFSLLHCKYELRTTNLVWLFLKLSKMGVDHEIDSHRRQSTVNISLAP